MPSFSKPGRGGTKPCDLGDLSGFPVCESSMFRGYDGGFTAKCLELRVGTESIRNPNNRFKYVKSAGDFCSSREFHQAIIGV